MGKPTGKLVQYTIRIEPSDAERVAHLRGAMSLDGAQLSEAAFMAVLLRRGLASLEQEIQQPRKAA